MVIYDIDDKYCPCGNSWIRVPNSTLFSDCYYCPHCDKIFKPTVKEVTKKWFSELKSKEYKKKTFQRNGKSLMLV